MKTQIPATIPAIEVTHWDAEVDVVVIGCGIAGGSAAVAAAQAGARVLVLEKAAIAGGTTSLAGGHFYLGGGTAVQQATGHSDSSDEMEKYLTAISAAPDTEKIHAYCRDSVDHFNWLEALGFEFERSYYPEKAVVQPGTQGLMYTGNEKVWPFKNQAVPAPRGHKVPVPGDTGGAKLVIDCLVARCAELGVEIRYETGARNLVADVQGAVVGVGYKTLDGEEGFVRCAGTIIAAGGFVMNEEMVAQHVPWLAEKPYVLGNPNDDGFGIRLGVSVGGVAENMDQAFITAPIYPPAILLTGLLVNKSGKRFVAEDSYHSRTSGFILDQEDAVAYLIVDEAHLEKPKIPLVPFIDGWETIEEMAQGLGLPVTALRETITRYNENAAQGIDPDFHKSPEYLAPQDTGPWGAFDLTLGKAFYAGFTMGGLVTSLDAELLNAAGTAIPGVYAVGAGAINIALDAKGYASGTQLGEGSYFGRRAGKHAAQQAF